jgi:hypothetical protein
MGRRFRWMCDMLLSNAKAPSENRRRLRSLSSLLHFQVSSVSKFECRSLEDRMVDPRHREHRGVDHGLWLFHPSGCFRLARRVRLVPGAGRRTAWSQGRTRSAGLRRGSVYGLAMAKVPTTKKPAPAAKNANPKGHKITAKNTRVTAHKGAERRNENKVRGR